MTPLEPTHNAALQTHPHTSAIVAAIEAAGIAITYGVRGYEASDALAAQIIMDGGQWLAQAKQIALDALAQRFASVIGAGVPWNGNVYQIDPASQASIAAMGSLAFSSMSGAPGAAAWPADFAWIDAGNVHVPMNAAQMYGFAAAVGAYVSAVVLNNRALKDAIAAAAAIGALDAIDLTSGWPAV